MYLNATKKGRKHKKDIKNAQEEYLIKKYKS